MFGICAWVDKMKYIFIGLYTNRRFSYVCFCCYITYYVLICIIIYVCACIVYILRCIYFCCVLFLCAYVLTVRVMFPYVRLCYLHTSTKRALFRSILLRDLVVLKRTVFDVLAKKQVFQPPNP